MAVIKPKIKGLEELGVEPNKMEEPMLPPSLKEVIDAVKVAYKEVGIEGNNILLGMLISMNDKNIATYNVFFSQLQNLQTQIEELKNGQKQKTSLITSFH